MPDKSNKATLSVVIPNYNHAAYLPHTLDAILAQSRLPDEIIVVDDASTDNSVSIIEEYAAKHSRFHLIKNVENKGVLYTVKKGLEMATGDYVHSAGADDLVLPGFYEKSMEMLESYPDAGLCSSLSTLIDESGKGLGLFPSAVVASQSCYLSPGRVKILLWRYGSWFMGNSAIFKRESFKAAGWFREDLKSYADGFCYEMIALQQGVCFIPDTLVAWRRMNSGYSSSTSRQVGLMLNIMERTEVLMRTTYASIFHVGYVNIWKRRQLLALFTDESVLDPSRREELLYLKEKFPNLSWVDKLFFAAFDGPVFLSRALLAGYLFFQKTNFQKWDTIRRRFFIKNK